MAAINKPLCIREFYFEKIYHASLTQSRMIDAPVFVAIGASMIAIVSLMIAIKPLPNVVRILVIFLLIVATIFLVIWHIKTSIWYQKDVFIDYMYAYMSKLMDDENMLCKFDEDLYSKWKDIQEEII